MGTKDHYVASLKASILKLCKTSPYIIDISHNISPFNTKQAAYLIKSSIRDFPDGSVHIIGVDAEPHVDFSNSHNNALPTIMLYKSQYFIGTDNGVFSLICEENQAEGIWELDDVLSKPELMNFPTKNILVPAACNLINGLLPQDFASEKEKIRRAVSVNPVIDGLVLKGNVIHIDHYGNLITNITSKEFERVGKGNPFIIYFRQKEYYIDLISTGYGEVPPGEKVAIFNDAGLLEIAINKGAPENGGGADRLLGMRLNDIVRVEFLPRGSKENINSLF